MTVSNEMKPLTLKTSIVLVLICLVTLVMWATIWWLVYFLGSDGLEKSISSITLFIQSVAIIFGGWMAYKKLILEKKIDEAIKIKGALLEYVEKHNLEASNYRRHKDIVEYKIAMINDYNIMIKNLQLSVLSKSLREDIFEALFLDIAVDKNKVGEEWKDFGKKVEKIYKKLDDIILY